MPRAAEVPSPAPPDVTIIVVTFNAETHLASTLDSITAQGEAALARVEVLIQDGASTDQTLAIAARYPYTRIRSTPDAGIYDAMNAAANASRGRWLHFLNAGDAFAGTDSLAKLLAASSATTKPWLVCAAQNLHGGAGSPARIPNLPHRWLAHVLGLQPHCHQACWFDRELFVAMGGYQLEYDGASDFDLIVKFGAVSAPATLPGKPLIDYLGGGVSERTAARTPELLTRIRRDRLGLDGPAARVVTAGVTAFNRARIGAGRFRARLRSHR